MPSVQLQAPAPPGQPPDSRPRACLVVNADDFGLSPGVTQGVLDAWREGIVRSASLMVTSPHAEAAARQAGELGLDLGLHLSLSHGRPACRPEDVASLVGADGRFLPLGSLLWRLSSGRVRRAELRREVEAQLVRAREWGARLSHLDGHHHVHVHPLVAPVVVEVAAAYRLAVRCPIELPQSASPRDLARAVLASAPALRLRRLLRAQGLCSSQHFRGLSLGYGFDAPSLRRTLRRLPAGLTELMCHPGYPDAALAAATAYAAGRERELAALTDPATRSLLEGQGVALVSWSEACQR